MGDEEARGGSSSEELLEGLRSALEPAEILGVLERVGLSNQDIAEGTGADERTVRRWAGGGEPTRANEQAIGLLRVLLIHILQRRGMERSSIPRWLRLADAQLDYATPLSAIAQGRLADAVLAADLYMAPREIGSWRPVPAKDSGVVEQQPTDDFTPVDA